MSRPLILVVDDDVSIVRLLWVTLTESGYDVITAASGAEALARLHDRIPDLIVLDLETPEMDGRTFYRTIRADARLRSLEVSVLILSASGTQQPRRELGREPVVGKPFIGDRLLTMVDDLLDRPGRQEREPSFRRAPR